MSHYKFTYKKPFSTFFFQSQEGLGCGRHAINNLFQEVVYDITNSNKIDLQKPKFPMNIKKLCNEITEQSKKIFPERGDIYKCKTSENYYDSVIDAALRLKGYENVYNIFIFNKNDLDNQNLNNKFMIVHLPEHWTCTRKLNDKYYYIDSMKGHIEFNTEQELKNYLKSLITSEEHSITIYEKKADHINPLYGGFIDDKYKQKYLKYKMKFLKLKKKHKKF